MAYHQTGSQSHNWELGTAAGSGLEKTAEMQRVTSGLGSNQTGEIAC